MPSTFSRNLGLELIATGEQAGVWGSTTNENFTYLDDAIDGVAEIIVGSSAYTVQTNDGAASEGRSKILHFTGVLSVDCSVSIAPNDMEKIYVVINDTTGGHALIFQQGSGSTFRLEAGYANMIFCDGAGSTASVRPAMANLQVANLRVTGVTTFTSTVNINGPLVVNGPMQTVGLVTVQGGLTLSSTLTAGGLVLMTGTVNVNGPMTVGSPGSLTVSSAFGVTVGATATLAGTTSVTGPLTADALVNLRAGTVILPPLTVAGPGLVSINAATVTIQSFPNPITLRGAVLVDGTLLVAGAVRFDLGGDGLYDLYYRGSAAMNRLPIGAPGTALTVGSSGGLVWANQSFSIGTPVPGSLNGVLFAQSGVLSQSATDFVFIPGSGLGVGTSTPAYTVHIGTAIGASATIALDGTGVSQKRMRWLTSGAPRFDLNMIDDGAVATSALVFTRFSNAGAAVGSNLAYFRNSGAVSVGGVGSAGDYGAALNVSPLITTAPSIIVKGGTSSGASIHLMQWQRSTGAVVALVREDGVIVAENFQAVHPSIRAADGGPIYENLEDVVIRKIAATPHLRKVFMDLMA